MDIILLSDIVIALIASLWLLVATIQDIKKREVANWLSFSLIIIALGLRAIASIVSLNWNYFLYGLGCMVLFFGIANIFYHLRVFAGGDAKLLTAIGTAFATNPSFVQSHLDYLFPIKIPFLATFLLNVLFVGSLYGLSFSIALSIRNFEKFSKQFMIVARKYWIGGAIMAILGGSILFMNYFIAGNELSISILSYLVIIFPLLFAFVKSVENACMISSVNPETLTEGDWIMENIKVGNKTIKPKFEGLSIEEVEILKERGKKVTVKNGIPFVPVFFIALIISFFVDILKILVEYFSY